MIHQLLPRETDHEEPLVLIGSDTGELEIIDRLAYFLKLNLVMAWLG